MELTKNSMTAIGAFRLGSCPLLTPLICLHEMKYLTANDASVKDMVSISCDLACQKRFYHQADVAMDQDLYFSAVKKSSKNPALDMFNSASPSSQL